MTRYSGITAIPDDMDEHCDPFDLTKDEEQELKVRPIGSDAVERCHWPIRRKIAEKIWRQLSDSDWYKRRPDSVKSVYETFPMWNFYVDRETGKMPRRAYGVCEYQDGKFGLHMVTAHLGWTNLVVGGVPIEDVRPIDEWMDEHEFKIQTSGARGTFFDPLGWLLLAYQCAESEDECE